MYTVLMIVQVLVAIGLIGLVLLQHGKGADAGAAFGSGASGTVFGSRGSANFLSRATGWLATVFFAVSLALAYLVHGESGSRSVVDQVEQAQDGPASDGTEQAPDATDEAPAMTEPEPEPEQTPTIPE